MSFAVWCLIVGLVLLAMALAGSVLKRLPLSASMLYLAAGFGLGPIGLGLLEADPFGQSRLFERLAEIAVLISLFVAGLKLSVPLRSARWFLPLRLAIVSMLLTIVLITAAGMWALGLPLGAAVLLGAILAPTDPVLASDVQLTNPADRDRLRFSLTGEAGLNDGVAFPFVMLGLGLLGLHELGAAGWKWLAIDVVWGIGAGLAAGGVLGFLTSRLVVYLRVRHREAVGLDEFLALGLIALSYGVALLMHTWGFLAVFAAGLAFRRVEAQPGDRTALHSALHDASELGGKEIAANEAVATDPRHASSYMTQAVLGFNEQLERVGEVALVIILGAMLAYTPLPGTVLWFLPLLFLVIRPASVWAAVRGLPCSRLQLGMMSWFGIRGVGSIYYLMFAINHGLPRPLAEQLAVITLAVVATSIIVHGISVTPLMRYYEREERPRGGA